MDVQVLSLLLLFLTGAKAWEVKQSITNGSPSRYVRTAYHVGLDEAVALTCSFRNTESSLGYFVLGTEADFTGRLIIWQKVDSTGSEELIATGSRVEPKLAAFHDYKVLMADATTSVLFIPSATHFHAGYYKCSLSDGGFLHQMLHLNVNEPYMVMRHPLDNTHKIAAGGDVRIKCDVKFTYPPPLIYWTYGRARLQKSVRPIAWGPVLSLNSMTAKMAGTYTCHADNYLRPPITTSYKVQLLVPKKPGSAPRAIKGQYNNAPYGLPSYAYPVPQYGQLYTLTCRTSGSSPLTIHWYKGPSKVLMMKDPNISFRSSKELTGDVVSELQFRQFKKQNLGSYMCRARNKFGSRYHTFQLKKIANTPNERERTVTIAPKPPVDDDDYTSLPLKAGLGSGESAITTMAGGTTTSPRNVRVPTTIVPSEVSGSGEANIRRGYQPGAMRVENGSWK